MQERKPVHNIGSVAIAGLVDVCSFAACHSKGKELVNLYQEFNTDAIIVLQSDKQFDGTKMWDALQSVELNWGDGDLFHWNNNKDYGHD